MNKTWGMGVRSSKIFCGSLYNGGGWFRLFNRGLAWKDLTKHPLLFSERHGFVRKLQIGNWLIKVIK